MLGSGAKDQNMSQRTPNRPLSVGQGKWYHRVIHSELRWQEPFWPWSWVFWALRGDAAEV